MTPSPLHLFFFVEGYATTERRNAVLEAVDYEAPAVGEKVRVRRWKPEVSEREDILLTVLSREWQYDTSCGGLRRSVILTCRREATPTEDDAYDVIESGGVG